MLAARPSAIAMIAGTLQCRAASGDEPDYGPRSSDADGPQYSSS